LKKVRREEYYFAIYEIIWNSKSVSINEILSGHRHVPSFIYCPWLLWGFNGRVV
jgi:hypothetical protein